MVRVLSKKPGKQRKALYRVKHHQASKLFTAQLDISLQEIYGVKRLPVRVDDSVRIVAGEFEGIEGKVLSLNKKTRRLTIEEATLQKRSGENYYVPVSVSKIVITKLETKRAKRKVDPWRERVMDRKMKMEELRPTSPKKKGKGDK